jgi:peptide-methionine (S)-S-oxide reductase
MKWCRPVIVLLLFLAACSGSGGGSSSTPQHLESKDGFTVIPARKPGERVAMFAGGCFWAMQECMLELKGVNTVVSGYAGGRTKDPTYESVLSKTTGHAESVLVYYDPGTISFEQLSEAFFYAHDPTQLNGQGPDQGSDYRSIAFYADTTEYQTILKVINKVSRTGHCPGQIVTELLPARGFYPAEAEHQDYYARNPWSVYIRNVSKPKVLELRKSLPARIKPEFLR